MSVRRLGCLVIVIVGLSAVAIRADDDPADKAMKEQVAQLEAKAKAAQARAAKFEEQADLAKSNADRSRLLKEAKAAREEVTTSRQAIQYAEARHLEHRFNVLAERMGALFEQLAKLKSEDERPPLVKEMNATRSQALELQKKVRRIMDELAPSDRTGFGPAHLWQADLLIRGQQDADGRTQPPTRGQFLQAERHLVQAMESPDTQVKAAGQLSLAKVCYETDRKAEAKRLMGQVAASMPEYNFVLAQWAMRDGERDQATGYAELAAEHYLSRLRARADDHAARFSYVDCLIMLKQFKEAREVLTKAYDSAQKPDLKRSYQGKLSSLVLAQLDARGRDVPFEEQLAALDESMRIDSNNQEVYARLVAMAQDGGPKAEKVRELMRAMTSDERRAALAHLYLGYDAFNRQDAPATRMHWEKAWELSKGAPLVANNLAWNLATTQPVDLERALTLIDDALKKAPGEPRFRSTRGQILFRLNRHRESLPDLLAGVTVYPNDPNLYRTLAEVVGRLGDRRKADEFAKRADALIAAAKKEAAKAQPQKSP